VYTVAGSRYNSTSAVNASKSALCHSFIHESRCGTWDRRVDRVATTCVGLPLRQAHNQVLQLPSPAVSTSKACCSAFNNAHFMHIE
jgi:hypothetical protein